MVSAACGRLLLTVSAGPPPCCTVGKGGTIGLLITPSMLGLWLGEVGGLCTGENGGDRVSGGTAACELTWKQIKQSLIYTPEQIKKATILQTDTN